MNSLAFTARRALSATEISGISTETIDGIIRIFAQRKTLHDHATGKTNPSVDSEKELPILDIFTQRNKDTSISTRSMDIQLTSSDKYTLANYAEFCHRVACLMSFGSSGPLALRYDVKKWSILKSPFIFKTAFKQYERRTYKRLVRIYNAHPALHQKYLWYIQHHLPSAVEFSSTIYEYEPLEQKKAPSPLG